MGYRTDGTLAVVVLIALVVAIVVSETALSFPWLVLGGLGTLLLETAMARRADAVRRYWERPVVVAGSLAVAIVAVALGAVVAPDPAISAGLGATVTYLVVLGLVVVDVLEPTSEWRN